MPELVLLVVVIAAAIGLGVVNGFNDAANAVAASVGSRSISPRNAIVLAAFCDFAGAATGLEVAKTIGKGVLDPGMFYSLPRSAAFVILVSALATAGGSVAGWHAVTWGVLGRIGASVVVAPALGFFGGFVLMLILLWAFRRSAPYGVTVGFRRLQWLTTAFLAYSHGKNDGQMPIGIITSALVIYTGHAGLWDNIPFWIRIVSAIAISLGILMGGWRVIKTVGMKITALQPTQGFASQFSAAAVIEMASRLGIPVSTTQCAAAATMGVGATRRLSAVRWGVTGRIVLAWVLTFPICAALGWAIASLLKLAV